MPKPDWEKKLLRKAQKKFRDKKKQVEYITNGIESGEPFAGENNKVKEWKVSSNRTERYPR